MKKRITCFFALVYVFVFLSNASAMELIGPKAYGMGGAFTAIADDASSLYWNPAGLAQSGMVGGELSFGVHGTALEDLTQLAQSIAQGQIVKDTPLEGSVTTFMGANMKSYSGGVIRIDRLYPDGLKGFHYSQMVGNLAFAHQLNRPLFNMGKTSFGVNLKLIQGEMTNYLLDGQTSYIGQGFGIDAGVLFQLADLLHIGATVKNIGPDLKLINNEEMIQTQPLEKTATLGIAVKVPVIGTTIAGDLEHDINSNLRTAHMGFNQNLLLGLFSVRGGMYAPLDQLEEKTLTAGLGLNLITFHGNLSVGSQDLFKEDLNGILSISMKF